jgi:hypothetical protein
VVSVGTNPPLVHVVETLTQEYCFPVIKSLPSAPLDSPQRKPLMHLPSSLGHLDAASTKELLHQGRGSPHPLHKVSSPLHTKPEGRWRLLVSHLGPKDSGEPCTPWFTQESPHKVGTTLHSLNSKLSLALSTYTKHMQDYRWAIKYLDGLDMIFQVSCTPLHFHTIQQPQMGEWRRYK